MAVTNTGTVPLPVNKKPAKRKPTKRPAPTTPGITSNPTTSAFVGSLGGSERLAGPYKAKSAETDTTALSKSLKKLRDDIWSDENEKKYQQTKKKMGLE